MTSSTLGGFVRGEAKRAQTPAVREGRVASEPDAKGRVFVTVRTLQGDAQRIGPVYGAPATSVRGDRIAVAEDEDRGVWVVASARQLQPGVADDDPRLSDAREPLPHGHTIPEVEGLEEALDAATGIDLSGYATDAELEAHRVDTTAVHGIADTSALALLTDPRFTDARVPLAHVQAMSTITGLTAALAGKSDTGHTHPQSDVTGLAASLALKQDAATAATDAELEAHRVDTTAVHGIADTSALVLTSDGRLSDARAPTAHTHPLSDVAQSGATAGQVPQWSGSAWSPLLLTDANVAAANKDGAAGTPSLRTLGTGAAQAAAGNDARLSNARTPTAHTHPLTDLQTSGAGDRMLPVYLTASGLWVPGLIDGRSFDPDTFTGSIYADGDGVLLVRALAIEAGMIAADAIDGKTITGALLRTSAAGARVEVDGTLDAVRFFTAADVNNLTLDGLAGLQFKPLADGSFDSRYAATWWRNGNEDTDARPIGRVETQMNTYAGAATAGAGNRTTMEIRAASPNDDYTADGWTEVDVEAVQHDGNGNRAALWLRAERYPQEYSQDVLHAETLASAAQLGVIARGIYGFDESDPLRDLSEVWVTVEGVTKRVLGKTSFGDPLSDFVFATDTRLADARAPTAHTHPLTDVTGLVAALAGKQDASTAATDAELTAHAALARGSAHLIASGTSFPSTPANGDEFDLIVPAFTRGDGATSPQRRWRCVCATVSSVKSWYPIGPAPLFNEVTTTANITLTSYNNPSTGSGPDLQLPAVIGDYLVGIGADNTGIATANATAYMSYAIGGTGAVDADSIRLTQNDAATPRQSLNEYREREKLNVASGVLLASKYKVSGGVGAIQNRWMKVTPLRFNA